MTDQPLDLDAIEGALPNGGLPAAWLDAIRTRYAAAEGGGWHLDPEPHTDPDTVRTTISGYNRRIGVLQFSAPYADENRAFVLHAHSDVGVLLAEVRRLTAELAAEQRAHGETINERDRAHDMADKLAQMIATEDMVGEHTGMNDPWQNTLDLWKDLTSDGSNSLAGEIRRLRAELATMTAVAESNKRYVQSMYQDLQQAQQQVADASAYRYLADGISATMPDQNEWDGDDAEETILLRYVQHLAEQIHQ